jgi:5-methylcytosine-specific restriction endonuclease McrA
VSDVLVLSKNWEPFGQVTWQRAFILLCGGEDGRTKAEVVEYDEKVVRSGSTSSGELREWKVPSVIRFVEANVPRLNKVKFSRENIYLRDCGTCQYCGRKVAKNEFEYEHVIPRSRGGKTTWDNIVVACTACNQKKGNKTPFEAGMKLLSVPARPGKGLRQRKMEITWQKGMPEAWKNYMRDVTYWKGELDNEN